SSGLSDHVHAQRVLFLPDRAHGRSIPGKPETAQIMRTDCPGPVSPCWTVLHGQEQSGRSCRGSCPREGLCWARCEARLEASNPYTPIRAASNFVMPRCGYHAHDDGRAPRCCWHTPRTEPPES